MVTPDVVCVGSASTQAQAVGPHFVDLFVARTPGWLDYFLVDRLSSLPSHDGIEPTPRALPSLCD